MLIPVALLGFATAAALASTHRANVTVSGKIARLSSTSIVVGKHEHRRGCAITAASPATTAFAVGDLVKIACAKRVLVAIADIPALTRKSGNEQPVTSGISGTVTAISPTSITVHDGDRNLTCTVNSASPSIAGLSVGSHVKIGCANETLVSLGSPGAAPVTTTTAANVTDANGPITALGASAITVQTMTCTIGPSSPATSEFKVGDAVRMYCLNGVLYVLKHTDAAPPPPTTTSSTTTTTPVNYSYATGTLTALSAASITVTGDGAPLTCPIGTTTQNLAEFHTGDKVRLYCQNGLFYKLIRTDTPATTTTTTNTATTTTSITTTSPASSSGTGSITTLSVDRITVTGDAVLSCSIGATSPSVSAFHLGDKVKMYCQGGALYALIAG